MKIVIGELTTWRRRVSHYHLPVASAIVTVEVTDSVILGRGSVVGSKDDEGVVEDASSLQLRDDSTDILVHAINHGCMYLHVCRLKSLVGLVLPLSSGSICGNRHLVGIDETKFQHTLVATLAKHIPPVIELAFVLRDILRLCLHGPMWFLESDVHEEGLAVRGHFIHHIYRFVCHEIGIVEVLWNAIREDRLLVVDKREGVEVIGHAPNSSPMLVESSVAGIGLDWSKRTVIEGALMGKPLHLVFLVANAFSEREVPFAAHSGVITSFAKHFGNRHAVARKALSHTCNAHGLCVATRHELSSRRTTATGIVELGETHTRSGERIKVRTLYLAAKAAKVRVAHIINYDEHDVRARGLLLGRGKCRKQCRQRCQSTLVFLKHSIYIMYNAITSC